MKREKNKFFNTIIKHTSDIIFGILAGSGLMFIVSAIITMITIYLPALQDYFAIMSITLYLFILITTSVLYAKASKTSLNES